MRKNFYALVATTFITTSLPSYAVKIDTIEDFSNETLVQMASHLRSSEDNRNLSLVSKRFNTIANDQSVLDGLIFSPETWESFIERAKKKVDKYQEHEWKNLPEVALGIVSAYANERDNIALQVTTSRALHVENFLDLPDVALFYIFSYLDLPSLSSIAQVSKRVKDISEYDVFWKAALKRAYTLDYAQDVQSWKKLYVLLRTLQGDLRNLRFNRNLFITSFNNGEVITKESAFYHHFNGFVLEQGGDLEKAHTDYVLAEQKGSIKAQKYISQLIHHGLSVYQSETPEHRYDLLLRREQKGDPYAGNFISERIHRGTTPFNTMSEEVRKEILEKRDVMGNTRAKELLQRGFGPQKRGIKSIGNLTTITDQKVFQETIEKAAKGDKKAQRDVVWNTDSKNKKINLQQGYKILNFLFPKRTS